MYGLADIRALVRITVPTLEEASLNVMDWLKRMCRRPGIEGVKPTKNRTVMTIVAPEDPLVACVQQIVRSHAATDICLESLSGRLYRIMWSENSDELSIFEFWDNGSPTDWIDITTRFKTKELVIRHGYVDFVTDRRGKRWVLVLEAYSRSEGIPPEQQVGRSRQEDLVAELKYAVEVSYDRLQPYTPVFSNL